MLVKHSTALLPRAYSKLCVPTLKVVQREKPSMNCDVSKEVQHAVLAL